MHADAGPAPNRSAVYVPGARIFARGAQANLHIVHEAGRIAHHMIEITFKTFAKALMQATRVDPRILGVPSTKGTLTD